MRISTGQIYQRGLDTLATQQERYLRLQQQQYTNLKFQSPSDDPVAAAQIEMLTQRINATELFQSNRQAALGSLQFEDSILSHTVTSIQRLQVIQVQAGNGALSKDDRQALAMEAQSLLNELQDYANTKDSNGNYMFSGSQTATQPISLNASGQYVYNGDGSQRYQVISPSLNVAVNDTGDALFMRIPNGNGRFTVSQSVGNTGTGSASTGSVVNSAAYVADDYSVNLALNSQNELVVMVTGVASGNVIPPSGLPDDAPLYKADSAISFNGMEITLTGTPAAGDSFAISPTTNESIFSTVQRMVANLNKPFNSAVEKAATLTENNQLNAQLDAALTNLLTYQSDLGARLNQLDSVENSNNNLIDTTKETLKLLREIDPFEVAIQFNMEVYNLQISQQSFAKIQGLSLFNYL